MNLILYDGRNVNWLTKRGKELIAEKIKHTQMRLLAKIAKLPYAERKALDPLGWQGIIRQGFQLGTSGAMSPRELEPQAAILHDSGNIYIWDNNGSG